LGLKLAPLQVATCKYVIFSGVLRTVLRIAQREPAEAADEQCSYPSALVFAAWVRDLVDDRQLIR
jgi:hypothetical protein